MVIMSRTCRFTILFICLSFSVAHALLNVRNPRHQERSDPAKDTRHRPSFREFRRRNGNIIPNKVTNRFFTLTGFTGAGKATKRDELSMPSNSIGVYQSSENMAVIDENAHSISPTSLPTPKQKIFLSKPLLNQILEPTPKKNSSGTVSASPSPKDYNIGRRFAISTEGDMSKILRSNDEFVQATEIIQNFTIFVETSIVNFLKNNSAPPPKQPLVPCNNDGEGFSSSIWNWFEMRQLPYPEYDCITEFSGTVALENQTEDGDYTYSRLELFDAFRTRDAELRRWRKPIADVLLGNWTEPQPEGSYLHNISSEQCQIYYGGGVKVYNKWYQFTSLTNAPWDVYLPLFGRQSIIEMIHVHENGTLIPLQFSAYKVPINRSAEHERTSKATTIIYSGQGGTGVAHFQTMFAEEVPSLISAMKMSDLWIQQAQDAITMSSLAILILPVFLNLMPIALLTQVKTSVMLLYTIMSDVVTVIPLGIKGWELMSIGRQRNIDSTIRITTLANGSISQTSAMQIWVTECRARQNVYRLGVVFFTMAVISVIIGVALEFLARAYMTRRRLKRRMFLLEHGRLLASAEEQKLIRTPLLELRTQLVIMTGTARKGSIDSGNGQRTVNVNFDRALN